MTVAVKDEEPDDADIGLPSEEDVVMVPPGVILDKLGTLLHSGKVLLQFQQTLAGDGWGVNGKVDGSWCSFMADLCDACKFIDSDGYWATESDGWADSEMQQLEKLKAQASAVRSAPGQQPSCLRPRLCRRAAFGVHRAHWAAGVAARRRAKVAAAGPKAGGGRAKPAATAAAVDLAEVAAAPAATAGEEAPPADSATAAAAAALAAARALTEAACRAEGAGRGAAAAVQRPGAGASREGLLRQVVAFKDSARDRIVEAEGIFSYREFLGALRRKDDEAVLRAVEDHDDLVALYKALQDFAKSTGISAPGVSASAAGAAAGAAAPAAAPAAEAAASATAPEASSEALLPELPAVHPLLTAVRAADVQQVLQEAQRCSQDPAVQLVRLVTRGRGMLSSVRIRMLRYVRTSTSERGSFRQVFIVRGPPGTGKSQWAFEQLRIQTGLAEEEEDVAKLAHICTADDFVTQLRINPGAATEVEDTLTAETAGSALASNEARVQLAMELGVQPLYVDAAHLQLGALSGVARLAQGFGYDVTFVEPGEVFGEWTSTDALAKRCAKREPPRYVPELEQLKALSELFEPLPLCGTVSLVMEQVLAAPRPAAHVLALPPPPPPVEAEEGEEEVGGEEDWPADEADVEDVFADIDGGDAAAPAPSDTRGAKRPRPPPTPPPTSALPPWKARKVARRGARGGVPPWRRGEEEELPAAEQAPSEVGGYEEDEEELFLTGGENDAGLEEELGGDLAEDLGAVAEDGEAADVEAADGEAADEFAEEDGEEALGFVFAGGGVEESKAASSLLSMFTSRAA